MRKLLAKRPHPYYIYAPDYRRTSSGIRVMHMLCDSLIRSGHEAYVTAGVLSPEFMTPRLTEAVIAAHKAQSVEPIVVYPEIVDGNPLNGQVVVRYILNRPGYIEGSGQFAQDDILIAYSHDLLQPGMQKDQLMFLPPFELNVFRPPENPKKRIPGKVCYYKGRRGELSIDPALLPPDAIEITPHWPSSWEEMADLFQQCEIFYCCGSSALATEAGLCGCLTVVLVDDNAPRIGVHETQSPGAAWGTSPKELERARQTLPKVRDIWLKYQDDFWPALDRFIDVTQKAAEEKVASALKGPASRWLADRLPSKAQLRVISEHLAAQPPLSIGVLVLDLDGDGDGVRQTINSLGRDNDGYDNLRIVVLGSEAPGELNDDCCSYVRVEGQNAVSAINRVVNESGFDWFILVGAGCEFTAHGLTVAAMDLNTSGLRAVYADEMMRQEGADLGALLRPDLNLDLLLSLPASMAHHWFFRRDVWCEMGGFREELDKACELEYILRLIETKGFDGLGHISEPLLIDNAPTLLDQPQEIEVIVRHLQARGYKSPSVTSRLAGRYEVDYGALEQPKVSILIVVKDSLARVQRCMDSLLGTTAYSNFEVLLLDHGSASPALQRWLTGVEQMGVKNLRVLRFDAQLSREQVQNQAAFEASGEFLLWLGEGAGILSADWLKQLANHAMRPEVGAVGAKLISGDGLIRHAGGILGLGGPVGRAFLGAQANDSGYIQRLQVDQNYSVLTGLCLMVRRDRFIELGGFNEEPNMARWADADLCLRLQQAGYLNVWTPRAQLLMDEPPLSAASVEEEDAMYARWLPLLARDPAYNPNFVLNDQHGFKLAATQFTWKPLQALSVPLVLAHNADMTGCGHYRIIQPHNALKEAGLIDGQVAGEYLSVTELERYNPDSIILQRQIGETHYQLIKRMKAFSRAFKVFELDDYLPNLPVKSVHRSTMPKDVTKSLRRVLTCVDRFVVSTEPLAEALSAMHGEIRVVKNRLDPRWWKDLASERRVSGKPRVGWAGGSSHTGDLEMIADVVKELAKEVEWVFFGMCPDKLRPYVHELHSGVDIDKYPAALARLNLDLAIAPVEQNLFNECKSNLRLLEYGACGFPVVCSDLVCYQGDLPVTRVRNRFKDWVDAIRMHLADLDATAQQGDALRAAVYKDWMLEGGNLELWSKAWLP